MSAPDRTVRPLRTPGQELALTLLAVLVLLCLMVGSYYYPYPSGKPPDLLSFAMFWLREGLILVFLVVCLSVAFFLRLAQLVRRLFGEKHNAP